MVKIKSLKKKETSLEVRCGIGVGDLSRPLFWNSWPYCKASFENNKIVLMFGISNEAALSYIGKVFLTEKKKRLTKNIILDRKNILSYKKMGLPLLSYLIGGWIKIVHKDKNLPKNIVLSLGPLGYSRVTQELNLNSP